MCVLCVVLTHYIQGVGMVDGSKLVLHQTGVVAFVGRHHALHDQGPVLATHLGKGAVSCYAQTETHTTYYHVDVIKY